MLVVEGYGVVLELPLSHDFPLYLVCSAETRKARYKILVYVLKSFSYCCWRWCSVAVVVVFVGLQRKAKCTNKICTNKA